MMTKIWAIGVIAMLVLGVGLVVAQENLAKKNEAESTGGIPEAGVSETELNQLIEAAKIDNFIDPVTNEIGATRLKDFQTPVEKIVEKLKSNGYSEIEIVGILKKHGMGYYPETGATWIGRQPTSEELQTLPPRDYPFDDELSISSRGEQRNRVMETVYYYYQGINNKMKPGSLAIEEDESTQHLATTHVGRGGHWTEAGVVRWLENTNWNLFTYDDDEGQWSFHGTTTAGTFNGYIIYVYPSDNYLYNIWIDGNWKRQGHLPYFDNKVDQANEVWSDTLTYTDDTNRADHKDPFLYVDDSAVWWDGEITSNWRGSNPVRETHYISGSAWRFQTWVDN